MCTMAGRHSMLAIIVLVVVAFATTSAAAAASAAPRPTFESLLQAAFEQKAGKASAKVASASGEAAGYLNEADYHSYYEQYASSYYAHSELATLSETNQDNCRQLGCQQGVRDCTGTGTTGGACYFCTAGFHVTSQFTCLRDQEQYYSSYGYGSEHVLGFNGQMQTGYCNWDVLKFRDQFYTTTGTTTTPTNNCGWIPITEGTTYQVGTATGKCFFPGGDDCEGPLCKSLRITISADVYATEAYSHVSSSAVSAACWQFLDSNQLGTACPSWPLPTTVFPINARQADTPAAASVQAAIDDKQVATASANYDRHYDNRLLSVYKGVAIIVSGQITSVNGARYEKDGARYTDGLIEYVPFFANTATGGAAYTGPIDPNIPFVRPNSYKLEFAKDGSRYY